MADSLSGEVRYQVANGGSTDFLTLVTTPYSGGGSNSYVGLGYWQRATVSGSTQDNYFESFVYGFGTPDSAVPVTGSATYLTDAFGLVMWPGVVPKVFSGEGTFDLDLGSGVFSSWMRVGEFDLTDRNYATGGLLILQAGGTLGSGNGFSGNFSYTGIDGTIGGTLDGGFYGPSGQEIGATFSGTNTAGAALNGAMTGQRDEDAAPVSLVLDNIVSETVLPQHYVEFMHSTDTSMVPVFRGSIGAVGDQPGSMTLRPDGSASSRLLNSLDLVADVSEADRSTAQRPNFDSYDITLPASGLTEEAQARIDLYKRGPANGEIQLTYASFGIWDWNYANGTFSQVRKEFVLYGFETPKNLLTGKTGSASYSGLVYGATSTPEGQVADVGGTSSFDVNFGSQTYSGSLSLTAAYPSGSQQLGVWTFNDVLSSGQFVPTGLYQNGTAGVVGAGQYNSIAPHFYGPDGEEIGATFAITSGWPGSADSTSIVGVTVAKRD